MKKKSVSDELRAYFSEMGRKGGAKGGIARAAAMTEDERRESAQKAINARWAKQKEKAGRGGH